MSTLRLRAVVIGLLLLVLVSFVTVYADLVIKQIQIGILQFAPAAVGMLLIVVVVNRLLRRVARRFLLSASDVFIIYAMLLIGTLLSSRGLVEKLIPSLVALNYYATEENRWREMFYHNIPPWLVAFDPRGGLKQDVARDFYEGLHDGEPIPWGRWLPPLVCWGGMVGCVLGVFLCLSSLLRRQWAENEKLVFPLVHMPLHVIQEETAAPFFRNRLTWMGFALPASIFLLNGLHVLFPPVPQIRLEQNLTQYLTSRPWNGMYSTTIYCSFAAIGFSYFLSSDLLFSLWFFFLLTRLQDVVATAYGLTPEAMPLYPTRLYIGYQVLGAYLVLAGYLFRTGWPHFRKVFRRAISLFHPSPLRTEAWEDREEMLPPRVAAWGVVVGSLGAIWWCVQAGMSWWLAAVEMGMYLFIVAVVMARSVAEAGLLMTETSFRPIDLVVLFTSKYRLGGGNLTVLAFLDAVFTRDLRGVLLSSFLDDQKMAENLRFQQRHLLVALVLAILAGLVCATYFSLTLIYRHGNITLYTYPNANALWAIQDAAAAMQVEESGSPARPLFFGIGLLFTLFLVAMRTLYVWWPFHPLGYALCASWSLIVFWFPIFVTWLLKSLILRYGGMKLYRQAMPFFLGLIMGEFTLAVFWATFSCLTQLPAPFFPWP